MKDKPSQNKGKSKDKHDDPSKEPSLKGGEKTHVLSSDTFQGRIQEASKSPPSLVILMGQKGYVGRQWLLNKSEMIIGRSVNSDIFLDDSSVSRTHAKLEINSMAEVSLMDLGSSNKTSVNTRNLQEGNVYKLKNNDQIKTGNVIFKFMAKGTIESASSADIHSQAQRDALTGIYNRLALANRIPEIMKRSEVLGEPLSIILFDIDHFKQINDNFGHHLGDYVLKEIAFLVQNRLLRSPDFFVRYGGEEFLILLSDTSLNKAIEVGERLRQQIEKYAFHQSKEKPLQVTISLGVVERSHEEKWKSLFKRCDDALYLAKSQGRNRVCTS